MTQDPKQQPQALEAEMAVLGSMLIERHAAQKGLDTLHETDFYLDAHKRLFRVIFQLVATNGAIDIVTVSEELRKTSELDSVGGGSYLAELINKVTTAAHVEHYARLVKESSILRLLISTATNVITSAHAQEKPVSELLDQAQADILKVSEQQTSQGIIHVKDLVHEVMDRLEQAHKDKRAVTGVPSGIRALDKETAGFQKSDLILIAARPSQGKTALALNIISHVVLEEKLPVAFFSLEMNKHAIMDRFVSGAANVDLRKIRTGYFEKKNWADITTALARFSESSFYIDDKPGKTVFHLRQDCRQLQVDLRRQKKELGLVVIDYLQLLRSGSKVENRQQEVSEISRGLKQLARELNVPVIALSQLSRASEDKTRTDNRPKLSDLRESGSLEQDADVVAMIHRESYYKRNDPLLENKAEIIIAKQRQGPTGIVNVAFFPKSTRFADEAGDIEAPVEMIERQAEFS